MTTPRVTVPVEPTEAMIRAGKMASAPAAWHYLSDAYRAMLSAAPAPEGGAVQWGWRVRAKPSRATSHRPWHWQADEPTETTAELCEWEPVYVALTTREEAPAEAGENDDDASTYRPSIAGLSDYLWNQALAADSVESRCILEMWREAVDSNAQTGESAKTLDRLCRVEDWAQAPSALRAQPPAREEAPAKVGEPAETGNGPLYDLVAFLRPEFREETKLHLARRTSDLLRAQPSAREDAQPVAWRMVGPDGGLIGMRSEPYHSGFERMMKADVGCVVQPLYIHPAPDALRLAVEALEKIRAVRVCKESANIWTGADACRKIANEALAALQAEQKGRA